MLLLRGLRRARRTGPPCAPHAAGAQRPQPQALVGGVVIVRGGHAPRRPRAAARPPYSTPRPIVVLSVRAISSGDAHVRAAGLEPRPGVEVQPPSTACAGFSSSPRRWRSIASRTAVGCEASRKPGEVHPVGRQRELRANLRPLVATGRDGTAASWGSRYVDRWTFGEERGSTTTTLMTLLLRAADTERPVGVGWRTVLKNKSALPCAP